MQEKARINTASNRTTSASALIVNARGLGKQVDAPGGRLSILRSVDFDVRKGESVAIVGPSGSGKSTLLGLLAGLDIPSEGEVILFGRDLGAMSEDQRARLRAGQVGFVFQSFQLMPGLTALENVMLPMELAGISGATVAAKALLEQVGLAERVRHYPTQLSGGEQQRVALARAFAARPKLLFADEPTGNLDTETGVRIIDLMFRLQQEQGSTLILVTHDINVAQRCSRRVWMEAGTLREEAP